MKKILILLLGTVLLTSCDKYLDVQPYGKTIPKTPEEFAALLHGHLSRLDEGDDEYITGSSSLVANLDAGYADNFETALTQQSGRSLPVYVGSWVSGYSASSPYSSLYSTIRDCNIVIGNMNDDGTVQAANVRATAHALRAVCYYQLLRLYCEAPVPGQMDSQLGMPLVVKFDMEAKPTRSTMQQTVDQIESDLKVAIDAGTTDDLYRFTSEACRGYLARLYFWTGQWQKAIDAAEPVVRAHPLLEGDAYLKMCRAPFENVGNHLFGAYRVISSTSRITYTTTTTLIKYRPVSKRFLICFAAGEDSTDVRYALSVNTARQAVKPIYCGMRSAELQLIIAESYYHLGQQDKALDAVNSLRAHRIRDVRPLTLTTLPPVNAMETIRRDATGKTLTPLLGVILSERRKEFFLEGDRFFELKRNGSPGFWTAYNGLKYVTQSYMYTLPIPESELRLVPGMQQNPGYTQTNE